MAGDLVERVLYTFESAWHHRFAPHGATNCYMEFSVPENRYGPPLQDHLGVNCLMW